MFDLASVPPRPAHTPVAAHYITFNLRMWTLAHLAIETMSAYPSAKTLSAVSGMLILLVVTKGMFTCAIASTKH